MAGLAEALRNASGPAPSVFFRWSAAPILLTATWLPGGGPPEGTGQGTRRWRRLQTARRGMKNAAPRASVAASIPGSSSASMSSSASFTYPAPFS